MRLNILYFNILNSLARFATLSSLTFTVCKAKPLSGDKAKVFGIKVLLYKL